MTRRFALALILAVGFLFSAGVTASPVGAATGDTVAEASSIGELLEAIDYTSADAATLRLYKAFFDREPDIEGAKYWISQTRKGATIDDLAYGFAESTEFQMEYGDLSDADFLTLVYSNVLGRSPDADGYQYWLNLMENQNLAQFGVVRWVVANDEFIALHPYASLMNPGFPTIVAELEGPLVGVELGTNAAAAERALLFLFGAPTSRMNWSAGCALEGGVSVARSMTWGNLTVGFMGSTKANATFRWWTFSTADGTKTGGPASVALPGGTTTGDLLRDIATANDGIVDFDQIWGYYFVDAENIPWIHSAGDWTNAATSTADGVVVGSGFLCD